MTEERWVTDADLLAARHVFADRIPGFKPPAAYSVARVDDGHLTFGHVNDPNSEHRLPAVVLASFCGYTNRTGTFRLNTEDVSRAVAALAPAEAATHWEHPNLWSWRRLLEQGKPQSTFIAFYLTDLHGPSSRRARCCLPVATSRRRAERQRSGLRPTDDQAPVVGVSSGSACRNLR